MILFFSPYSHRHVMSTFSRAGSVVCRQHKYRHPELLCANHRRRGLPVAPLTSARSRLLVQPLGCFHPHFQRVFMHRHHTAHRHSGSRLDWGMPEAVPQIRALLQTAAQGDRQKPAVSVLPGTFHYLQCSSSALPHETKLVVLLTLSIEKP